MPSIQPPEKKDEALRLAMQHNSYKITRRATRQLEIHIAEFSQFCPQIRIV
jgi:hypothetical protein